MNEAMTDVTREGERPREPQCMEREPTREGERPREPFPVRHHPSKNSVRTIGFRSTILFVTLCTEGRMPILANHDIVSLIVSAWLAADKWIVGQYVIMPDHIHFFCSPATNPPYDFQKWIIYWKRLTTQIAARADARPPRLWQSGCWDTQIRTGSQYKEKWEYVRNNPVRKGFVVHADDWPYQGRMNVLEWHERM